MALPQPDETAIAHSASLLRKIRAEIEACDGAIGFDQFMDKALYDPEFGYYCSGLSKFGESGDFTTAPEVSPLFAHSVARVSARVLEDIADADILEIGAGTGRLAADMLLELDRQGMLPKTYYILELSAELRARQQRTIELIAPELVSRVCWLNALDKNQFSGIVIANEVMDAMPVKCFCIRKGEVFERCVSQTNQDGLVWRETIASRHMTEHVTGLFAELAGITGEDYCSEYNPWLCGWLESLRQHLRQGLILLVDYGYERRDYYHPQRSDGTLLCHYRQHAHSDPFFYPGLQDISANVDFTAVALAAQSHGFDILAYSTQAQFLLAQGILDNINDNLLQQGDAFQHLQHSLRVKSLIMPTGMGERFHMLAMGKDYALPNAVLTLSDQRARL